MKKYFLSAVLLLFLLCGCDDSSSSGSINESFPPIASDEYKNINVTGVYNFDNGSAIIPHDNYKKLVPTFVHIPSSKVEGYARSFGDMSKIASVNYLDIYTSNARYIFNEEFLTFKDTAERDCDNISLGREYHSRFHDRAAEILDSDEFKNKTKNLRYMISPKIFTKGEASRFNIQDLSDGTYKIVSATCQAVSDHAYFFIEDGGKYPISIAILQNYVTAFETLYNTMHNSFGVEDDVDANGKVIILFFDMSSDSLVGYFDPTDKSSSYSLSNEADIFYINTFFARDQKYLTLVSGTLAHEFQHMIYFDSNPGIGSAAWNKGIWLNEGLSMLAEYLAGFYVDGKDADVNFFLHTYGAYSLTLWTDYSYGYSSVFTRYFYEQYGDSALKKLYGLNKSGISALETVTGVDFNDLYMDFVAAVMLSGRGITNDKRYNFSSINIPSYNANRGAANVAFGATPANVNRSSNVILKPYGFYAQSLTGVAGQIDLLEGFGGFVYGNK